MSLKINVYPCPGCGEGNSRIMRLINHRNDFFDSPELYNKKFDIVQCNNCGLVYVKQRIEPGDMENLYRASHYKKKGNSSEPEKSTQFDHYMNGLPFHIHQLRSILDIVERYADSQGNFLDIGCSFGHLVEMAGKRGWQAEGLEISKESGEWAEQNLGIKVHNKSLREFNGKPGTYNVVTAIEYFEHTSNLKDDLATIFQLLKTNGLLVATVPNLGSLRARYLKEKWRDWDPVSHLTYFKRKTFNRTLRANGFEPMPFTAGRTAFRYINNLPHSQTKKLIHGLLYCFSLYDSLLVVAFKK